MRYYSDVLHTLYDTDEELKKAEAAHDAEVAEKEAEKARVEAEKKALASEIETAKAELDAARKHYSEVVSKYVEKYGTYRSTTTLNNAPTLYDMFNCWFK